MSAIPTFASKISEVITVDIQIRNWVAHGRSWFVLNPLSYQQYICFATLSPSSNATSGDPERTRLEQTHERVPQLQSRPDCKDRLARLAAPEIHKRHEDGAHPSRKSIWLTARRQIDDIGATPARQIKGLSLIVCFCATRPVRALLLRSLFIRKHWVTRSASS